MEGGSFHGGGWCCTEPVQGPVSPGLSFVSPPNSKCSGTSFVADISLCCPVYSPRIQRSCLSTYPILFHVDNVICGAISPPSLLSMSIRRMLEVKTATPTAEHYRRLRQELTERGASKNEHATSTKNNIRGIKERWKKWGLLQNY